VRLRIDCNGKDV
jgi:hypothetical protein